MSTNLLTRLLMTLCCFCTAAVGRSSPFNSEDGFPFTAMNGAGDFAIAGNIKSYVSWQGQTHPLR